MITAKIADLYGEIRLKGMAKFTAMLQKGQSATQRLGAAWRRTGMMITRWARRAGLAVAAFAVMGVRAAMKFEKAMARVSTMMGPRQMGLMQGYEKAVKALSIQYGKSTGDLANALFELRNNSVEAEKALEVLKVAARGAVAGFADTEVVAIALSKAMFQFKEMGAERIMEVLFAGYQKMSGAFADLAREAPGLAINARRLNVTFEETVGVMAFLSKGATSASEASNNLQMVMGMIASNAPRINNELKKIGVTTQDIKKRMAEVGFVEAFRELFATAKKAGFEIGDAFRRLGAGKVVENMRLNMKDLVEDVKHVTNETGAFGDSLEKASKTAIQRWNILVQRFQALAVTVGDVLMPILEKMMKWLEPKLKAMSKWVDTNSNKIQEGLMAVADAMKPLIGLVMALARHWKLVLVAFLAYKGAQLGSIAGPWGAVAGAAAGATAGIAAIKYIEGATAGGGTTTAAAQAAPAGTPTTKTGALGTRAATPAKPWESFDPATDRPPPLVSAPRRTKTVPYRRSEGYEETFTPGRAHPKLAAAVGPVLTAISDKIHSTLGYERERTRQITGITYERTVPLPQQKFGPPRGTSVSGMGGILAQSHAPTGAHPPIGTDYRSRQQDYNEATDRKVKGFIDAVFTGTATRPMSVLDSAVDEKLKTLIRLAGEGSDRATGKTDDRP